VSEPERQIPEEHHEDFATFWDVARRQYTKNKPAMVALYGVLTLIALAVAAPLISFNVPLVMKTADGIEWPLFARLFDRLLFPSGVDVFFNLLLVLGPVWLLGARLASSMGFRGNVNETRAVASALALVVILVLYVVWSQDKRGIFGRLIPFALAGVGLLILQAWRTRGMHPRIVRKVRTQTRVGLASIFLVGLLLVLFTWRYTAPVVVYSTQISELEDTGEGWAIRPWIPYHPDNIGEDSDLVLSHTLQAPSKTSRNYLGCDNNGRDVLARILFGTRISLTIGIIAVSIYGTIGMILGSIAGYFGGWIDMLIVGMLQVMICIPQMFLLLTIMAVFDTRSIFMIMVAIGLTGWTGITRLVRGEFFRQRNIDYVTAARALGLPQRKIIFGHILKNAMAPVLVAAAFGVAGAILSESFLAFIGLGDTNAPSWGQILQEGRAHRKNWLILSPGFAIFAVVTMLNLVGDGLRDALDPKLRQ